MKNPLKILAVTINTAVFLFIFATLMLGLLFSGLGGPVNSRGMINLVLAIIGTIVAFFCMMGAARSSDKDKIVLSLAGIIIPLAILCYFSFL